MDDMVLDKNYARGSNGGKARLIQEWLCLHGFNIATDGNFGPATDYAVREFQKKAGLAVSGVVDQATFTGLIQPMANALKPISGAAINIGQLVVKYAEQHLAQHPREIGGQNKGPWVRLYMDGNEGPSWPWCAGFASFVLKQACWGQNASLPVKPSYSCDILAADAMQKGRFLTEATIVDRKQITPGSFFLVRRTPDDWEHTGIVLFADNDIFHTIEGNTNDEGSREGYEVCRRTRGYEKKDFIIV